MTKRGVRLPLMEEKGWSEPASAMVYGTWVAFGTW